MPDSPYTPTPPASTWTDPDGTWRFPTLVARPVCRAPELTPAERYFIVRALGVDELLSSYWDHPEFWQQAQVGGMALGSVDRTGYRWLAKAAYFAWAEGDVELARTRYREGLATQGRDLRAREARKAARGGMVRLAFVEGDYGACIDHFIAGAPPPEYFEEEDRVLAEWGSTAGSWRALEELGERFPETCPALVSNAKYMLRAITAAAVQADRIDDEVCARIAAFFRVKRDEIPGLAAVLRDDAEELERLRDRIRPEPATTGATKEDLLRSGQTARAREIVDFVPFSRTHVDDNIGALDHYLASGAPSDLDAVIASATRFSIKELDELLLRETFQPRIVQLREHRPRHAEVIRRLGALMDFPPFDYLEELALHFSDPDFELRPSDLIDAMLHLGWSRHGYWLHSDFYKNRIAADRDLLEIQLERTIGLPALADLAADPIGSLFRSYEALRALHQRTGGEERWVSEARLGKALESLFGEATVQRHARPAWLSPQHLDFLIPSMNLAVEYMGLQHYQPVEHFGGELAFKATVARDRRKWEVCERVGVSLEYVTYEEDIAKRAREIFERHGPP